jgi:carboxylesterase
VRALGRLSDHREGHPVRAAALTTLAAVVTAAAVLLFTPILDRPLATRGQPASSSEEAMARATALTAADGPEINPVCRSRVLSPGERTERSVVLLHGYTNCPQQFDTIAQAYADAGYSVVVPRLPGHGASDRLTKALSDVHPDDLVRTADLAVDIAAGLGDEVTVVGLSGGGTLAGWLATERDDVTRAVLIAPLVIPKVLPESTVAPLARFSQLATDVYLWWDSEKRERLADPPYAYPRYSVRSLGAFLSIGRETQTTAPRRDTSLERLVVITNENDGAVSNVGVAALERHLERLLRLNQPSVDHFDYVFPESAGYKHDLVDPNGENAEDIDAIYRSLRLLLDLPRLEAPAG